MARLINWQPFQLTWSSYKNLIKSKRLIWQRQIFIAAVAFASSFLIHLLMPAKAPAQELAAASAIRPIPQRISFSVPQSFQGQIIGKVNLSSQKKLIALTFDDGPSPNITPPVLDILKEKDIKATFFLVGENLKNFPEIGRRMVAEGHAIGNHTWHHWGRQMNEFTAFREIHDTATLISQTTGVKTSLFRPPHGYTHNGLADYALKRKDLVVLWSVDSGDWRKRGLSVEGLVNNVVEKTQPGAIILMHDGGGDRSKTVKALPNIIDELTHRGYKFVTVPELLQVHAQELTAQLPK